MVLSSSSCVSAVKETIGPSVTASVTAGESVGESIGEGGIGEASFNDKMRRWRCLEGSK
ncbi:hypothetical protein EV126DRAFT_407083 [Verticillium dahliae]|nr:hypothetical protein EV126DRAFT_407083 [Verticillium dahliae]